MTDLPARDVIRVEGEIDTGLAQERPDPRVYAYRLGLAMGKRFASGLVSKHEIPIEAEYRVVEKRLELPE